MASNSIELCRGAALFGEFIEELGISQAEAARQLKVQKVSILQWVRGYIRPRPEMRFVIERWSQGRVPAMAWLTDDEHAQVAGAQAATPAAAENDDDAPASEPRPNGDHQKAG
jgi:DNA-binding XRE family transcriptional regulator